MCFRCFLGTCMRQSSSCELWTKAYLWRLNFSVEFSEYDCRLIRCLLVNIMVKLRNSGPTNTDAVHTKEDEFWMDGVHTYLCRRFDVLNLCSLGRLLLLDSFLIYCVGKWLWHVRCSPCTIDTWTEHNSRHRLKAAGIRIHCTEFVHEMRAVHTWCVCGVMNVKYQKHLFGIVGRQSDEKKQWFGMRELAPKPTHNTHGVSFGILFVASKLFIE